MTTAKTAALQSKARIIRAVLGALLLAGSTLVPDASAQTVNYSRMQMETQGRLTYLYRKQHTRDPARGTSCYCYSLSNDMSRFGWISVGQFREFDDAVRQYNTAISWESTCPPCAVAIGSAPPASTGAPATAGTSSGGTRGTSGSGGGYAAPPVSGHTGTGSCGLFGLEQC